MTAMLLDTDLTGADLTGCYVYGVSAWGLKLEGATQLIAKRNLSYPEWSDRLLFTGEDMQSLWLPEWIEEESEITLDNIEVAQFIHLMLNNQRVRDVIDTITSKMV